MNNYGMSSSSGNPWGQAADTYQQGLNQLLQIRMKGQNDLANAPLNLYDRFMDGYEKARKRAMDEEEMGLKKSQLDRQNRLADLAYQKDSENETYRRSQLDRQSNVLAANAGNQISDDIVNNYEEATWPMLRQRYINVKVANGTPQEQAEKEIDSIKPKSESLPSMSFSGIGADPSASGGDEESDPSVKGWGFDVTGGEKPYRGLKIRQLEDAAAKVAAAQEAERIREDFKERKAEQDKKLAEERIRQSDTNNQRMVGAILGTRAGGDERTGNAVRDEANRIWRQRKAEEDADRKLPRSRQKGITAGSPSDYLNEARRIVEGARSPGAKDDLIGKKTKYPNGTKLKDGRTIRVDTNGIITSVD